MPRYKLTIEYDGQGYMGWQRQPHGRTIQASLEDAVQRITGTPVTLFGCGRTDAGVHAKAQVAHVDVAKNFTAFRLSEAINAVLRPQPIAVVGCEVVAPEFHARFDCRGRGYEYRIRNRRAPLTLASGREWRVSKTLDEAAMQAGANHLIGCHDFTTFRAAHCQAKSPVRTMTSLTVRRRGDLVTVSAAAPSFLHHQIRSITGCLMMVGDGRWPAYRIKEILDAKDRTTLGLNAPPDGLYFMHALYD